MRVWWVTLVAGCGFQVDMTGGTAPVDAPLADSQVADMPSDVSMDADPIAMCPMGYQTVGTLPSKYLLRTQNLNVKEHHAMCSADGTHLAVIDNAAEAGALRTLVNATSFPGNALGFVWIGVAQLPNQASVGAGWINATGGTFNVAYWDSGEPNDVGNIEDGEEQFAAIWKNHNLVADVRGDDDVAGLCECDSLAITPEYEALFEE